MGPLEPAPEKRGKRGGLSAIAIVACLFFGVSVLGVLAIFTMRKYLTGAKTAESRNVLGQIGKDAVAAYDGPPLEGSWATSTAPDAPPARSPKHGMCPSTTPVPTDLSPIIGRKYQSSKADWASWRCLGFELSAPQYYQYRFDSNASGFTAFATGDLDGDGILAKFELRGKVIGDELRLDPQISQTDPDE